MQGGGAGNASPRKASHGHDTFRTVDGPYHPPLLRCHSITADYSGSSSTVTLNVAVGGPYHPPFCGNKGLARTSLRALPGLWPAHTFPGTGHEVLGMLSGRVFVHDVS